MYEVLFRHVLFPAYETLVKRRSTASHVAEYDRSQWLDRAALEVMQLRKLNELLAHCWAYVPFLQRHWREHGVAPGALQHPSELARYPVLTKALISRHYDDMIATNWRGRTLSKATGGSTGEPFRFEYTMDVYARRTAVMWRGYGWGGAHPGTRTGYLWGHPIGGNRLSRLKDYFYHGAFNRHFFDAFSLTEENIDSTIDELVAYQPKAIVGYVTPLAILARRMIATNRSLEKPRGVLTGAEALSASERHDIHRAFGCPVFNTYGSREVMLMASECERHEGLHVNADHLILETLDANGQCVPPGNSGDVAITDLHNYGMPMVRYMNGDRATYSINQCSCGRGLPLLASVDGRILDMLTTPDGRLIPGEYFPHLMKEFNAVKEFQVRQFAENSLEILLVIDSAERDATEERLRQQIQSQLGPLMRISFRQVQSVPLTKSGKRRVTIKDFSDHPG